jgi:methyl-accepting chemotaxis protein
MVKKMQSGFMNDVIRVTILTIIGTVSLSYTLYKIYGNNLVFKMWIRICPAFAFTIVNATFCEGIGWTRNWTLLLMDSGLLIAIVFGSLVITGRYFQKNIERSVTRVKTATEEVTMVSMDIADTSRELAQSASEQAASNEKTSSSIEEITSMVEQNEENAKRAANIVEQANNSAKCGIGAMKQMEIAIYDVEKLSDETAKIIKTIDEIAFQTNLLALNASIEAARAGDAGLGFAVVAEEVRNLARKSTEASKYTADLILKVQESVKDGVDVTNKVNVILQEISSNVTETVNIISEVTVASGEQSRGIQQVNQAVSLMDKETQRNSTSAEESAVAVQKVAVQTKELTNMIDELSRFVGLK